MKEINRWFVYRKEVLLNQKLIYELKVFEDGENAVCKLSQPSTMQFNTILQSHKDLFQYLKEVLSLRWPLEKVLQLIDSAEINQRVEFK